MNQKANSVADLAAVLLQQERPPTDDAVAKSERKSRHKEKMRRQKGSAKVKGVPVLAPLMSGGVEGVRVRWADMLDAEFAQTWPAGVLHDELGKHRYTAAFPPPAPVPLSLLDPEEEGANATIKGKND